MRILVAEDDSRLLTQLDALLQLRARADLRRHQHGKPVEPAHVHLDGAAVLGDGAEV